jgi:hypothetical protein
MAMASVVPAGEVTESAEFIIPLTAPCTDEALDLSYGAAADMYFQLLQMSQPRFTYEHCAAYSADAPDQSLEIGSVV